MPARLCEPSGTMSRREFVKATAATAVGLALEGWPPAVEGGPSKYPHWGQVVVARDHAATDGARINGEVVRSMLDRAVLELTQGRGWGSLFPGYRPGEGVAIKINSVAQRMTTHREVLDAIVHGLGGIGVRPNDITVWDTYAFTMTAAGYDPGKGPSGARVVSADGIEDPYDRSKPLDMKGETALLSRILTEAKHLINAPILKDHWEAGITFALKNHVGSIDRPKELAHHPPEEGNMMHSWLGRGRPKDDCIALINTALDIRDKTRLIVGDALFGVYQGGPGGSPQFAYNGLIVGVDPVATDHQARRILDEERSRHDKPPTNPLHIEEAIRLGLGASLNEIQVAQVSGRK